MSPANVPAPATAEWPRLFPDSSAIAAVDYLTLTDRRTCTDCGATFDASDALNASLDPSEFNEACPSCHNDSITDSLVLRVTFKSGTAWDYFGVSEDTARAMVEAESVGKYFHANIKGKYAAAKVEEVTP